VCGLNMNGVDEQLGIRIIRTAVDGRINFMDNCWQLQLGGQRNPHGQGAALWLEAQGFSDDKN
jgi:hypothetical protein